MRVVVAVAVVVVLALNGVALAASGKDAPRSVFERGDYAAAGVLEDSATFYGRRGIRLLGKSPVHTAVAMSKLAWSPRDVRAVFLVNVDAPLDGLVVGGATREAGPVLFVRSGDRLPGIVANELWRLQPCVVIAVGPVDGRVVRQAQRYASACSDAG